MLRARPRKRPCKICRKWFLPNPKLKKRQATCGDASCQRKWHRRKCREWNNQNKELYRSNYLQTKLDAASNGSPCSSQIDTGLPAKMVRELIGTPQFVVLQYLGHLILRRTFQTIRTTNNTRGP